MGGDSRISQIPTAAKNSGCKKLKRTGKDSKKMHGFAASVNCDGVEIVVVADSYIRLLWACRRVLSNPHFDLNTDLCEHVYLGREKSADFFKVQESNQ